MPNKSIKNIFQYLNHVENVPGQILCVSSRGISRERSGGSGGQDGKREKYYKTFALH